jgi:hypothetical protein
MAGVSDAFKPKVPATVKSVEPKLSKEATRHIVRYGPYKLGAANVRLSPFLFAYVNTITCHAAKIKGFSPLDLACV